MLRRVGEFHDNLWAPWRMAYIRSLSDDASAEPGGCFLCRYAADASADAANHVIWRTEHSLVLLNRFPYTNGHLLLAPRAHKAAPGDLSEAESLDLLRLIPEALAALGDSLHAQGFNIGMNLGHCAGAGLPDHLHWHIVPRWSGDTNYMAVIGDVRVIPDSLTANAESLRQWSTRTGRPGWRIAP